MSDTIVHSINQFADKLLFDYLSMRPDLAANLGLNKVGDAYLAEDRLPDYTPEGVLARRSLVANRWKEFKSFDLTGLLGEDLNTARVLEYILGKGRYDVFAGVQGHDFFETPYPLTQMTGVHADVIPLLCRDHEICTKKDAENYLSRIEAFPTAIQQTTESLSEQRQQGHFAHRALLDRTLQGLESFLTNSTKANILYTSFAGKLLEKPQLGLDSRALLSEADKIIAGKVYPAYHVLLTELHHHQLENESRLGVWHLPKGEEFYAWKLRTDTTTAMTPDEVHEMGLRDIEDLKRQIHEAFKVHGITGSTTAALYQQMDKVPTSASWPENPTSEFLVQRTEQELARMQRLCRPLFNIWPAAGTDVVAMAAALEDSMHTTYIPPQESTERNARYILNLKHTVEQQTWEADTVCHHEAYPGHHLQLQVARELTHLPLIRRTLLFNAYLEGWAKYAEKLPISAGFVTEARIPLGRLRSELASTVNLVVETGVHWKRWTRQQAIDFFQYKTGFSEYMSALVVDRGAADPGQLCSYKVGLHKVREYRESHKSILKNNFNARDFHDSFLGHGALPFEILDDVIREDLAVLAGK